MTVVPQSVWRVSLQGERYQRGLEIRREVLGAERVDRAIDRATPFSLPLQELVTEYCWGAAWARPGLQRRVRSLINLGMLTALGRSHELALHVRGAIENGCSRDEIRETLLQATIYCGVPAGLDAFRVAEAALDELNHDLAGSDLRDDDKRASDVRAQ